MADDEDIGIVVASTAVTIVPDTSKFGALLKSELNPQADVVGQQIGQQLAETIARSIQQGLKDGLKDAPLGPATDTGSRTGGAFANAFKDRVNAALRDLPDPQVGLDATELDTQLADIRGRLKSLGSAKVGVDIDDVQALAELETIRRDLDQLRLDSPDINVQVDTARAIAQLEAVKVLADSIKTPDLGRGFVLGPDELRSLTVLPTLTEDASKGFLDAAASGASFTNVALALTPALIPIGAALTGALAGGVTLLGALAGGLGVVALGASGVAKAVSGEVTPAFHELQTTAANGLLPGVESGIHSLLTLLPELDGFVGGLAHDLGGLAAEGSAALTSPYWQQFFEFISSEAGPILTEFSRIIGNLGHGFAGLVVAFKPVTDEIGRGLVDLSGKFANWAGNAGSNSSFQSFLRYIETEGPEVVTALGHIAVEFADILKELAPVGDGIIDIVNGLSDLKNAINNLPGVSKIEAIKNAVEGPGGIPGVPGSGYGLKLLHDITGLGGGSSSASTPDTTSGPDLSGFEQNISGVEGNLTAIDTGVVTATTDLAAFYTALGQSGVLDAFGSDLENVKVHILDTSTVLKQASSEVNAAIVSAVTPAVTGITAAVAALSSAQKTASHSDFDALISHQAMVDANAYAKAWQDVATKQQTAAGNAKTLADAIDDSTAAGVAAKAQAEALVTSLQVQADGSTKTAKAAQDSADKQTKAYQQIAASAEKATQDATAAAQQLVANIGTSTNALLSEVSGFRDKISGGISQGTDLGSIWQSLVGTDANGNPVDPTIDQVSASLDKTLAQVVSFDADLNTIRKEGGPDSDGLIESLTGLGDVNGDALAKELIAAGQSTIQAFEQTTNSIEKLSDQEGAKLAKSFYGDGVNSMENLIKGIEDKFPALQSALAPLIEALEAAFTITPTLDLSAIGGPSGKTSKASTLNGTQIKSIVSSAGVSASTAKAVTGRASSSGSDGQSTFTGSLTLDSGAFVGQVSGVLNNKVSGARQLEDAGMPGSSLTHLANA